MSMIKRGSPRKQKKCSKKRLRGEGWQMSCFWKNSNEDMRHKASGGKIWGNANFQLLLSFANATNIFASDQIVVVIFFCKIRAVYFITNQPGKQIYVRTLFQNSIIQPAR